MKRYLAASFAVVYAAFAVTSYGPAGPVTSDVSPATAVTPAVAATPVAAPRAIELAPVVITARYARATKRSTRVTAPSAGACNFDSRPLVQGSGAVRGFCGGL